MKEITAKLNYCRVSPRKARLVVDLVRGKTMKQALAVLKFADKKMAPIVAKLLKSAANNAKHDFKIADADNLLVKIITVDAGPTMKRFMPAAMGSAHGIKKRTSRINVILSENKESETKNKKHE